MYIYYNANPDGKSTGDCVIRAISAITGRDWEDIYLDLALEGLINHEMMDTNELWSKYLWRLGFRLQCIPPTENYTIRSFSNRFQNGAYLLGTGRHLVAVIDGDYYDAWDSGNEVPVFYWRLEN